MVHMARARGLVALLCSGGKRCEFGSTETLGDERIRLQQPLWLVVVVVHFGDLVNTLIPWYHGMMHGAYQALGGLSDRPAGRRRGRPLHTYNISSPCSLLRAKGRQHTTNGRELSKIKHLNHLHVKASRAHVNTMTWATSAPAAGVSRAQLNEVIRAIHKTPIIDNHAHPLLKPEALAKYPLISITTEASGDAIHAAFTSLSHLRGVKQLAHVLDCAQTWEAVVAAIEQRRLEDYDDWISECLDGIETILVDDGLDAPDDAYDYEWHNSFTRSGCKRIARIETVAGRIIQKHASEFKEGDNSEDVFDRAIEEFDTEIRGALADPEVVGFKSVICYRTGLDIPAVVDLTVAKASFDEIVTDYAGPAELARIQHPGLNDLLVHRAAALISEMPARERKPLQFHTGLGDNDLTLAKSSPAHLQEFIRTYPEVPIVLLHASYPFVRELGYLATVYANVYAVRSTVLFFVTSY